MKRFGIVISLLIFVLSLTTTHAYDMPQNGHDWKSLLKSEKVNFCTVLIFDKEGIGVYPTEKVKLVAYYFSGKINYYYENHSLDDPISKAESWAYPEAKKMLDELSSKDKKTTPKK